MCAHIHHLVCVSLGLRHWACLSSGVCLSVCPQEFVSLGICVCSLQGQKFRVVCQSFIIDALWAILGKHECRNLCDGRGCVGGGAHGTVLLPPLAPLHLILGPLSLQSHLDLQMTHSITLAP